MGLPTAASTGTGSSESVNTIGPSGVMATVCSQWADNEPSCVRTVHPSASTLV